MLGPRLSIPGLVLAGVSVVFELLWRGSLLPLGRAATPIKTLHFLGARLNSRGLIRKPTGASSLATNKHYPDR